jgi:hypothetical protein
VRPWMLPTLALLGPPLLTGAYESEGTKQVVVQSQPEAAWRISQPTFRGSMRLAAAEPMLVRLAGAGKLALFLLRMQPVTHQTSLPCWHRTEHSAMARALQSCSAHGAALASTCVCRLLSPGPPLRIFSLITFLQPLLAVPASHSDVSSGPRSRPRRAQGRARGRKDEVKLHTQGERRGGGAVEDRVECFQ